MTGTDPPTDVRVDHVGVAVEDVIDESLFDLLGVSLADRGLGPGEAFRYHYYELGDASRLELIEPVADESFLTDYLERYGEGVHHVTLEVGDLEEMISHLRDHDVRVVDYEELDEFVNAFVSPADANGVLYQLVEYHESFDNPIGGCALSHAASQH
ncbi:VOC family protein [Halostella sp. JP-L12]|uniref:VOC family protein n=1 Tax=Halostella TaxID=1843185 RepID=UPI000EF7A44E|nr:MULTISPECIES: VOC family protein [Halostella]NHN49338.1 VOC family protein [Halostella sp. JP-L12]